VPGGTSLDNPEDAVRHSAAVVRSEGGAASAAGLGASTERRSGHVVVTGSSPTGVMHMHIVPNHREFEKPTQYTTPRNMTFDQTVVLGWCYES
jgi:hypothetical protein